MRGSVYYQATQLVKCVFKEGLKKPDRVNPTSPFFGMVASYRTMQSYRSIWENFFNYLKEQFNLKDCERIDSDHVASYMLYKIEYYPSKQYLEKISAAMGKLEIALERYSTQSYESPKHYDFSIRQRILDTARDLDKVADNYHDRAYAHPEIVIETLHDTKHRLAARIQLEGGARMEGIGLIKRFQLKGIEFDTITKKHVGVLETREKGGKIGDVKIDTETYGLLSELIDRLGTFRIDRQSYMVDIRKTCSKLGIQADGSHGFRWNFAQRRMLEYAKAGYSYEQSLQLVSWEMKHNRASITEHYL